MLNDFIKWKKTIFLLVLFLGIQFPRQESLANSSDRTPIVNNAIATSSSLCSDELKIAIKRIINRPEFARSRWGILIQTLDGKTLYSLDSQKYFIPASNVKLLTTAAALLRFGSQFRLRTSAYSTGTIPHLETLRIVGVGDPSFTSEQLINLAQQLKRKGVRKINKVIVEDSYFEQRGIYSSWEWEDLFFSYGTSINSLILNENSVTLTLSPRQINSALKLEWSDAIAARQWQINNQTITAPEATPNELQIRGIFGSSRLEIEGKLAIDSAADSWNLAIVNPNQYFLDSLLKALINEGIQIEKGEVVAISEENSSEEELAFVESEPLAVIIEKTNKESNNLYAEALLQILARESIDKTGTDAIAQQLTQLGVAPDSYVLVDGSGLSRHNLVSPEAMVQTLRLMAQTSEAKTYRDSLAVAGVSGTLSERFKNTLVEKNLQAKTGTLSGNSALSGYLNNSNYEPLVFSIIVNQSALSASNLRSAIDEIVVLLSQLRNCQASVNN